MYLEIGKKYINQDNNVMECMSIREGLYEGDTDVVNFKSADKGYLDYHTDINGRWNNLNSNMWNIVSEYNEDTDNLDEPNSIEEAIVKDTCAKLDAASEVEDPKTDFGLEAMAGIPLPEKPTANVHKNLEVICELISELSNDDIQSTLAFINRKYAESLRMSIG